VYPMEVEGVLADPPSVAAAAVVPPSRRVRARSVCRRGGGRGSGPPRRSTSFGAFGAERLGRHKLPEQLAVIDELPLTPMEKLDPPCPCRALRLTR